MAGKPSLLEIRNTVREVAVSKGLTLTLREELAVMRAVALLIGKPTILDLGLWQHSGREPKRGRPYGGGGYLPTADEQWDWPRKE